jgi:hypothetical protein
MLLCRHVLPFAPAGRSSRRKGTAGISAKLEHPVLQDALKSRAFYKGGTVFKKYGATPPVFWMWPSYPTYLKHASDIT